MGLIILLVIAVICAIIPESDENGDVISFPLEATKRQ